MVGFLRREDGQGWRGYLVVKCGVGRWWRHGVRAELVGGWGVRDRGYLWAGQGRDGGDDPGGNGAQGREEHAGGGKLWWRSGGARRRQGTARSHTFGIRCEVCQRARTCSLSVVRKGGGSWKAYSSTTSTNFYLLLLPAATTRLLLLLLLLHRARAQPGADSGFCCERCCHAISAVRSTRDDGSCRG